MLFLTFTQFKKCLTASPMVASYLPRNRFDNKNSSKILFNSLLHKPNTLRNTRFTAVARFNTLFNTRCPRSVSMPVSNAIVWGCRSFFIVLFWLLFCFDGCKGRGCLFGVQIF